MPAHPFDADLFNTPERAIRFILGERSRNRLIAAIVAALAFIVTVGAIYRVYRDIPAPQTPANAIRILVEPYH